MTRTDFPDWPSHENPPSQRLPAIQQRWWWQQTSDNKISIIDEYGFAVASDLDALLDQLCQGLDDLGWHPAAVSQALDDLQAQQLLDSKDDE